MIRGVFEGASKEAPPKGKTTKAFTKLGFKIFKFKIIFLYKVLATIINHEQCMRLI